MHYRTHATARVARAKRSFESFPQEQQVGPSPEPLSSFTSLQDRVPGFLAKIASFAPVIATNAALLETVAEHCQIFPENAVSLPA